MDVISFLGLLLIAAGWCLQYISMGNGKSDIDRRFLILNVLGILFLIFGAFQSGAFDILAGNLLTFIGALLVLTKIKSK